MFTLISSRISTICLLATLMLVAVGSLAETGQRDPPEMIERGAHLYQQYCSICHGKDGVGEPPIPWSIRRLDYVTAMPLDESSHAWHHGDDNLVQIILKGTRKSRTRMPTWEDVLSVEQVRDLVAYIKGLWGDRILECQGPRHMSCM